MKLEWSFLRSRVARRIFILFVLCALLPIAVLAVISFGQVTQQLNRQSQRRLHQASKAVASSIYERLLLLEAELRTIASSLRAGTGTPTVVRSEGLAEGTTERLTGLVLMREGNTPRILFGGIDHPAAPTPGELAHLTTGRSVVSVQHPLGPPARTFISTALDLDQPARGILLGEINPSYLWGIGEEDTLPPNTELCILDDAKQVLICSLSGPISFPEEKIREMTSRASGQFEWTHQGREFLAGYWTMPLQFRFFVPTWTVVLSESKAEVLAPVANFRKIFPLVVLMALWIVIFLSIGQIRRSLVPLEKLQEGTRRIAARDFTTRVTVTSGDEFEELAGSFNTMANRLGKQFNTLATMADIDRAILSTLQTPQIVEVTLHRLPDVLPCDGISVSLLDPPGSNTGRTYVGSETAQETIVQEATEFTPQEVHVLRDNPETLFLDGSHDRPHYLGPLARRGMTSSLVLPIFLKERLSGVIALGHRERPEYSQEDLTQARQLADQVAVALANAGLIEELDKLNWGTLIALARAIDAKSPWTAGHSERVTELALKIGRQLGLTPKELDVLHRGGLLHDIGKIGIPAVILDKPGRLTDEEIAIMREHPRKGARILEPIPAYAEVIPIVLQHHEWINGAGYPDGLAGEAISLGGRIFAVADVFDALSSDRPYRRGMDREKVIEIIKKDVGRQFDAKVVEAFLAVMAGEETTPKENTDQSRAEAMS